MTWEYWYILFGAPLLTFFFLSFIRNLILVVLLTGLTLSLSQHALGALLSGQVNIYFTLTMPLVAFNGIAIATPICGFLWWRRKRRMEAMDQDGAGSNGGPE